MAKPKKKFDLDLAMVKATKNGQPKKSKSKITVVETPELKYVDEKGKERDHVTDWVTAASAIKTAQSIQATAEKHIRPLAHRLRCQDCQESHEFKNSVKLRVIDSVVTFTQKSQFSSVPQELKALLVKTCAEEGLDYDKCFSSLPVISLRKELDRETISETVKKLFETFGEKFTELFKLDYPICVAPEFAKDLIFDPKARKVFQRLGPESEENVICPHKASISKG